MFDKPTRAAWLWLLLPAVVVAQPAPSPAPAPAPAPSPGIRLCPCPEDAPATAPAAVPFLEPVLGANAFTLGWTPSNDFPAGTQLGPSVRAGMLWPNFFADLRLGFSSALSPAGGAGQTSLALDAEVGACPYRKDEGRLCGSAGLGGGLLLDAAGATPTTSLTLSLGYKYDVTPDFGLGIEGGARTQLGFFPGDNKVSTGLYVAFTGTWYRPFGLGLPSKTREKEPPPAPPPHSAPGETPAYGTSSRTCHTYVTDGWFSPTQGVWQDDPVFEDRPKKQLVRRAGGDVIYDAELDMVQGKDTLLFGVHHYRLSGSQVTVDSRDVIVLKGMTNCSVPRPVKMKFTSQSAAGSRVLHTSLVFAAVPLEGAPLPGYVPWEVRLPVRDGVPEKPFRFDAALTHRLVAELIHEAGAPTGLQMTVATSVVATQGPVVHFVPVLLSPPKEHLADGGLELLTGAIAGEAEQYVPDIFPLRPGGLPVQRKVLRNFIDKDIGSTWFQFRRTGALVAALNDSLAASAFLDGAGRVVAVMSVADYEAAFGKSSAARNVRSSVTVQARVLSWKVILTNSVATWQTVAHELTHSLPGGWSSAGMQAQCGRDYHNKEDPVASGERITRGGTPVAPERKAGLQAVMGPAVAVENLERTWITQCSYAHLLQQLAGAPPDPPVLLVRAWLTKEGGRVKGELRPMYELMGYADVAAGKGGPYAAVLRDEKGAELGRYPLSPEWNDIETGEPRSVVSMVFRVPALPPPASVELVGPGGVLDRERLSVQPPSLQILTPAEGEKAPVENGRVRVTWKAEGEAGRKLLYSILYSADGGEHFATQAFEIEATSFDVTIDPQAKDHRVKVVVTDGTRSSEAVIPLRP